VPVSAIVCAVVALVACGLSGAGMFVAMGAGLAAVGLGMIGFGRRRAPGPSRLLAATAIALGGLALVLAIGRYAVTLLALRQLVGALG
jgi:hypothetical protein